MLGLMAGPKFIRDAFGDASTTKLQPAPAELDAVLTKARKSGRSLLVLVVPADVNQRHLRGQAWGSFLLHSNPAHFNLLAGLEVVCAPMKDVNAPGTSGEPWALYFDATSVRAVNATIPPIKMARRGDQATANKSVDSEIESVGAMLANVLPSSTLSVDKPDRATVHRLREDAPPGSRWDKVGDCPMCGMGFTPPKSARFLTFFVKGEPRPPKPFGEPE